MSRAAPGAGHPARTPGGGARAGGRHGGDRNRPTRTTAAKPLGPLVSTLDGPVGSCTHTEGAAQDGTSPAAIPSARPGTAPGRHSHFSPWAIYRIRSFSQTFSTNRRSSWYGVVPVLRQYLLNRAACGTLTWVLTVRKFRLSHFICRVLVLLKPSISFHAPYCSTPVYYSTAVIATQHFSFAVISTKFSTSIRAHSVRALAPPSRKIPCRRLSNTCTIRLAERPYHMELGGIWTAIPIRATSWSNPPVSFAKFVQIMNILHNSLFTHRYIFDKL